MSDVSTSLPHAARLSPFKALFRVGLAAHGIFFVLALFYLLTFDEVISMQRVA